MSTPVKYFAVFGLFLAVGLLVYNIFFKNQGATTRSLLVGTKTEEGSDSVAVTELLLMLKGLEALSLDTSIFTDRAYRSLRDYSVIIDAVPQGKENPFAPL